MDVSRIFYNKVPFSHPSCSRSVAGIELHRRCGIAVSGLRWPWLPETALIYAATPRGLAFAAADADRPAVALHLFASIRKLFAKAALAGKL